MPRREEPPVGPALTNYLRVSRHPTTIVNWTLLNLGQVQADTDPRVTKFRSLSVAVQFLRIDLLRYKHDAS